MKKFTLFLVVLLIIGGALMLAGFLGGGKTFAFIDRSGLHLAQDESVTDYDLGAFSSMSVNLGSCTVDFVEGADYGVRVETFGYTKYDVKVEDGVLFISDAGRFRFSIGINFRADDRITVTIPRGAEFDNVNLSIASGQIRAQTGIDSKHAALSVSSGSAVVQSIDAETLNVKCASGSLRIERMRADDFDLKVTSGGAKLYDAEFVNCNVNVSSGGAKFYGTKFVSGNFKCSSGEINMEIKGVEDEYSRHLSANSGSVKVGGKNANGAEIEKADAKGSITAHVSSGSIKIEFLG